MNSAPESPLQALLNTWAHSPRGRPRNEDGLEATDDFLGEFNIDLLLEPSPPPHAHGSAHVNGSASGGVRATSAAHSRNVHAPRPGANDAAGLAAPHAQQQQQQAQQQHASVAQQQAALGQQPDHGLHQLPGYVLSLPLADAATLQAVGPAAGTHLPALLQLAPSGSGPSQQYMPLGGYHPDGVAAPALVLPALTPVPAGGSQQHGAPSENTNNDGKRRRGPRPRVFKKHTCQSDGCTVDLAPLSFYLQRNHICPDHLKADSYLVKGLPSRFCQRCGQGHPITEFEGSKRSCRKALERHNQRRRDKQAASAATNSAAPEAPAAPKPDPATDLQAQQPDAAMSAWLGDGFAMQGQSLLQPSAVTHGQQEQEQEQQQQHIAQEEQDVQQQQSPAAGLVGAGFVYQPAQQQEQHLASVEQQWVTLPRHLLEQHAPHLLSASLPTVAPTWQQASPQQAPTQHMTSPQPPAHAPQPQMLGMIEKPSFSLWHGEFGGSGI